jgi:hypothetical protein
MEWLLPRLAALGGTTVGAGRRGWALSCCSPTEKPLLQGHSSGYPAVKNPILVARKTEWSHELVFTMSRLPIPSPLSRYSCTPWMIFLRRFWGRHAIHEQRTFSEDEEGMNVSTVLGAPACGLAVGQIGGKTSGDPRVTRMLDSLEYKYDLTKSLDFSLTFKLSDGRSQVVFVNSNTEHHGDFEIREIWSTCYRSTKRLSPVQFRKLLSDSGSKKLGAYSLISSDEVELAIFSVKAVADVNADDMQSLIQLAITAADEMEMELTVTDDL